MPSISLRVNGAEERAEIESRTLLVDLLRGTMGLTGTHVGCETSQCGACVVHVNGKAVKACAMFALEADGADVVTIEGMAAEDGTLHPIQEAFREHHSLQCGYCTPGMIMSTAALLKGNPSPSEEEVRHALEGNICRCTGYQNIVKAVLAAADTSTAAGSAA